jgi:hypothetical protein
MAVCATPHHVKRFAEVALRIFGHEGTFEIAPTVSSEFSALCDAFRELGCEVVPTECGNGMQVTCASNLIER